MGIIALALVASGHLDADFERPPTWVIASAALAMGAGTYAGGWRIIRTLGQRIAKIDPPQGFAAQTRVRVDPLDDRALRVPRLDDPHDLGLGPRRRRDPRLLGRPLGRRRATSSSPGSSRCRRPRSSARGWRSSPACPGGHVIVFALAILIAAAAFAARRWETRRLAPPPRRRTAAAHRVGADRDGAPCPPSRRSSVISRSASRRAQGSASRCARGPA